MVKRDVQPLPEPPADCRACPLRQLELFAPSDDDDHERLRSIRGRTHRLKHGEIIHSEGDAVTRAFTLFDGYAIRYRTLASGERQVLQFMMSGDLLCHLEGGSRDWPDTAEVVGYAVLCSLSAPGLQALFENGIRMAHQIAEIRRTEMLLLEELMMDMGQQSAFDGVARLLLELFLREHERGRTRGNRCFFPFRQKDIGDALSLSSVHISRVYADLRDSDLMSIENRWLTIPDRERAMRRLDYEPSYLRVRPLL